MGVLVYAIPDHVCVYNNQPTHIQGEYELNEQHSMVAHKLLQRVKTDEAGVAQAGRPPRGLAKAKKGLDRVWFKKATGRSRK